MPQVIPQGVTQNLLLYSRLAAAEFAALQEATYDEQLFDKYFSGNIIHYAAIFSAINSNADPRYEFLAAYHQEVIDHNDLIFLFLLVAAREEYQAELMFHDDLSESVSEEWAQTFLKRPGDADLVHASIKLPKLHLFWLLSLLTPKLRVIDCEKMQETTQRLAQAIDEEFYQSFLECDAYLRGKLCDDAWASAREKAPKNHMQSVTIWQSLLNGVNRNFRHSKIEMAYFNGRMDDLSAPCFNEDGECLLVLPHPKTLVSLGLGYDSICQPMFGIIKPEDIAAGLFDKHQPRRPTYLSLPNVRVPQSIHNMASDKAPCAILLHDLFFHAFGCFHALSQYEYRDALKVFIKTVAERLEIVTEKKMCSLAEKLTDLPRIHRQYTALTRAIDMGKNEWLQILYEHSVQDLATCEYIIALLADMIINKAIYLPLMHKNKYYEVIATLPKMLNIKRNTQIESYLAKDNQHEILALLYLIQFYSHEFSVTHEPIELSLKADEDLYDFGVRLAALKKEQKIHIIWNRCDGIYIHFNECSYRFRGGSSTSRKETRPERIYQNKSMTRVVINGQTGLMKFLNRVNDMPDLSRSQLYSGLKM